MAGRNLTAISSKLNDSIEAPFAKMYTCIPKSLQQDLNVPIAFRYTELLSLC